jgi:hypothetical protein
MFKEVKFCSILACSIFLLQSCSNKSYPSLARKSALVVDGKSNDWNLPLKSYDPESKINYEVSNDAENLYMCMKLVDQQSQYKFLQNGFQLEIGSSITKGKKCLIEFPLADNIQPTFNLNTDIGNPLAMDQKIRMLKANSIKSKVMMRLKGFANLPEGDVSLAAKTGVNVAINFIEDDILIYEVSVPLKSIINRTAVALDTTAVFSMGFTLKGKEVPAAENDAPAQNGMQGSGGMPNRTGMPGANGMGGGRTMPDSDRPQIQQLYQESRFIYRFKLAGL